jgi:mannose/fructose/N-acetylgalactosamine-specific phosphotransferase system component IIB
MMPLSLVRIDDRLIHGQVVLGWARVLKPDRIVVANDRVAKNDWERRLYTASVPPQLKTSFLTLGETAAQIRADGFKGESVLLLFESVADAHGVVEAGVQLDEINVGGLHYREGTRELLPFVYVSEDDRRLLKDLVGKGVRLIAQDIPGNPAINLNPLVTVGAASPSAGI